MRDCVEWKWNNEIVLNESEMMRDCVEWKWNNEIVLNESEMMRDCVEWKCEIMRVCWNEWNAYVSSM